MNVEIIFRRLRGCLLGLYRLHRFIDSGVTGHLLVGFLLYITLIRLIASVLYITLIRVITSILCIALIRVITSILCIALVRVITSALCIALIRVVTSVLHIALIRIISFVLSITGILRIILRILLRTGRVKTMIVFFLLFRC